MDKLIVLSGVNMVEGGILTVYRTMIATFSRFSGVKLICLVHDTALFEEFTNLPNVEFHEYKEIKTSWFKRLKFEFLTSYRLSQEIKPDAWICLHDMSARVATPTQFVYCHNPSPFYQSSAVDLKYDRTFYLFTKFYRFLYGINIKANRYVIVQQQWIARYFKKTYGVNNMMVARPVAEMNKQDNVTRETTHHAGIKTLLYPAFPRTFKNFSVLVEAMDRLKQHQPSVYERIEILLTFDKGMTRFGDFIIEECEKRQLNNIRFIGLQSKQRLDEMYRHDTDALIFPSKLETWGLPLSEAKAFNVPILSADLPYAHETIGDYDKVAFFEPDNATQLAEKLTAFCEGKNIFAPATFVDDPAFLTSQSWDALANNILKSLDVK